MSGNFRDRERMHPRRCAECICGIRNETGIWCVRLKRVPTPEEARRCPYFCPKAILDEFEYDA